MQMPKKREHVSLFFDFWREKVSVRELSDDFGTVYDPFLLVGETVVLIRKKQSLFSPRILFF